MLTYDKLVKITLISGLLKKKKGMSMSSIAEEVFRPTVIVRVEIQKDDSVLLVKRSNSVRRTGQWEFPGGKLDEGETITQAAFREAKEELGIEVKVGEFLDDWINTESKMVGILFAAKVINDNFEIILSEEHDEYRWVNRRNWKNLDLTERYYEYFYNRFDDGYNDDKLSTESADSLIVYTDGGSRGNPGPSATGYVIYDSANSLIESGGSYLGVTTNNQAEYHALLEAAKQCLKYEPKKIIFSLDSQLVVNQMTGRYKIKNKDLWPVNQSIKETLEGVKVEFKYVPREKNKEADAMVNKVLDSRKTS